MKKALKITGKILKNLLAAILMNDLSIKKSAIKIRTDSEKSVLIIYRSTSKAVRYLSAKGAKTC